jgi:2-amino-4-hydroxy-6-hydroxymethyldihydropteridine diphosphokinase/dihydroneopterin aldolase/2-amino-4-hydroxy-6-hydroxymethyldihydropteridine diphosphokinase
MNRVLITLGSNVEKETNLPHAIAALRAHPAMAVKAVSPVYETAPIGSEGREMDQPAFFNAAAWLETMLEPPDLRAALRAIEATMGRMRTGDKFAPRPIDLDIAFYNDTVIQTEDLNIPDPDVERFPHLAFPLADVAPDWQHPTSGRTLRQIAAALARTAQATLIQRQSEPIHAGCCSK